MKKVIIASENPAKIRVAGKAFSLDKSGRGII